MRHCIIFLSLFLACSFSRAASQEVVQPRMWVHTMTSTTVPEAFSQSTASGLARVTGTTNQAKLSWTSATNWYRVGDVITVSGASDPAYNGTFNVTSAGGAIASSTWITYTTRLAPTNASPTGTIVVVGQIPARSITIVGKKDRSTANTGDVYFGPSGINDYQYFKVTTGTEVVMQARSGEAFILSQLYLDIGTSGDGILIFFY